MGCEARCAPPKCSKIIIAYSARTPAMKEGGLMKIGNIDFYFDIERQKYVMYLPDEGMVKVVAKDYIKHCVYNEVERQFNGINSDDKQKIVVSTYKAKIKLLFERIEAYRFIFDPHKKSTFKKSGIQCKNLYKPTNAYLEAKKARENAEVSDLHKSLDWLQKYPHINRLLDNLCVSDNRKEYFINWLATALVTLKKNRTAILFRGIPGAGKGVLWEQIIEYVIGQQYTATISNDDLKNSFNAHLENKLFILANEIKGDFREGNTIYEKLKMYVTDTEIRLEQKGVDVRRIENYFNLILNSNNSTPLQIQGNDRRYTVFETASNKLLHIAEKEFGETIDQFIQGIQGERDEFLKDLLLYDFDASKARVAMDTEEKEQIFRASITKSEILAEKIKDLDIEFFENDVVELAEMMGKDEFKELCERFGIPIVSVIGKDERVSTTLSVVDDFFNELYEKKFRAKNKYFLFFYTLFTGEKSPQKLGTMLTNLFGRSIPYKDDSGESARYRKIRPNQSKIGMFFEVMRRKKEAQAQAQESVNGDEKSKENASEAKDENSKSLFESSSEEKQITNAEQNLVDTEATEIKGNEEEAKKTEQGAEQLLADTKVTETEDDEEIPI